MGRNWKGLTNDPRCAWWTVNLAFDMAACQRHAKVQERNTGWDPRDCLVGQLGEAAVAIALGWERGFQGWLRPPILGEKGHGPPDLPGLGDVKSTFAWTEPNLKVNSKQVFEYPRHYYVRVAVELEADCGAALPEEATSEFCRGGRIVLPVGHIVGWCSLSEIRATTPEENVTQPRDRQDSKMHRLGWRLLHPWPDLPEFPMDPARLADLFSPPDNPVVDVHHARELLPELDALFKRKEGPDATKSGPGRGGAGARGGLRDTRMGRP